MAIVKIVWATYLLIAFVIAPAAFALRYRRSPIVAPIPPRDRYGWIEAAYATLVLLASALLFAMDPLPINAPAGLTIFAVGFALMLWAMADMGPNWRIGQDPDDATVHHVNTRLYRLLKHPIYVALVLLALGILLLAGPIPGPILLLTSTILYVAVQSKAETYHWNRRRHARSSPDR